MKIQRMVLAGSLLLVGTNYAQRPAALSDRPAATAHEPSAVVAASLRCVAPLTRVHAAWRALPTKEVPVGLYWVRLRGPQGYHLTPRVVLS